MEWSLYKEYEEPDYVLVMGKVLRLEIADEALTRDGVLDVEKAKPLTMVGGNKGMRYCTIVDLDRCDSFGAMFPDDADPLERLYSKPKS